MPHCISEDRDCKPFSACLKQKSTILNLPTFFYPHSIAASWWVLIFASTRTHNAKLRFKCVQKIRQMCSSALKNTSCIWCLFIQLNCNLNQTIDLWRGVLNTLLSFRIDTQWLLIQLLSHYLNKTHNKLLHRKTFCSL